MIHITWSGVQEDESTARGDTRGAFATVPRAELAFGATNALAPPPPLEVTGQTVRGWYPNTRCAFGWVIIAR